MASANQSRARCKSFEVSTAAVDQLPQGRGSPYTASKSFAGNPERADETAFVGSLAQRNDSAGYVLGDHRQQAIGAQRLREIGNRTEANDMEIQRRQFFQILAAVSFGGLAQLRPVQAQERAAFRYQVLDLPQTVEAGNGKIEVIEFFWYGCPHCYALEPAVENWARTLPSDVSFRRIPAPLGQAWVPHALAFYAFETLGVLPKLHRAFFDAIHRDRLRIENRPVMEQWLQRAGVSAAQFNEAVGSFSVQSSVRKAIRLAAGYQITGVPSFAVQGRYVVSASEVGLDKLLAAVDQLTALARNGLSADGRHAPAQ
jgi:thiol:disulfide interchange protein DsbA